MNTKKCIKCKTIKQLGEYNKTCRSKDGHQNTCRECHKAYKKEYYRKNKQEVDRKNNNWAKDNREKSNAIKARYVKNNPTKRKASIHKYDTSARGRAVKRAQSAKRRAAKFRASPSWSRKEVIDTFYAECPSGYHVDHIIPLNSNLVCGLHVIANLQYLPAEENIKKSNKLLEGYRVQ